MYCWKVPTISSDWPWPSSVRRVSPPASTPDRKLDRSQCKAGERRGQDGVCDNLCGIAGPKMAIIKQATEKKGARSVAF